MSEPHPLGRHVEHDPRSRAFPVAVDEAAPLVKKLWRRYGSVLDQGQLGSCTGNAMAGALNTLPIRKTGAKALTEKDAVSIYEAATIVDGIPGQYPPDDTGSSGLAVCKVAKTRGMISSYTHAFSLSQALAALMHGPVITGIDWYEGFDNPSADGLVEISGSIRGGHEIEVLGFDPAYNGGGGLLTAVNSWGKSWGIAGRFFFTAETWGALLANQGDVTVPLA